MARSIVVEAAVHGCIHPGTKGAVMRGIKEEREGEKDDERREEEITEKRMNRWKKGDDGGENAWYQCTCNTVQHSMVA